MFSILVNSKLGYGEVIFNMLPSLVSIIPAVKLIPCLKSNLEVITSKGFLLFNKSIEPLNVLQLYLSHFLLSTIEIVVVSADCVILVTAFKIESLIIKLEAIILFTFSISLFIFQ